MYCAPQIVQLAGEIYTGIGAPANLSVGYISGWLTSSGNLGGLNNKLTTCFYFSGDGSCIVGGFGGIEASIYQSIYTSNYYLSRANVLLAGGDTSSWISLAEGDSKVTREGISARAKVYLDMYSATTKDLNIAIANWKLGHTPITTVDASELPSWPSP